MNTLLPKLRLELFPAGSPAAGSVRRGSRRGAFTLLEILVSVALLSFIVLGLFAMFNQTQRAFKSSMTQSDILEAGRAVAQMIPRDLEEIAPSYGNAVNFAAVIIPGKPLTQFLPGAVAPDVLVRTNFLQDVFMLLRDNQTWVGIGYCVRTQDTSGKLWLPEADPSKQQLGPGSLYRFTATLPYLYSGAVSDPRNGLPQDPSQLYVAFRNACVPGSIASQSLSNRICDGVVHFHMRAYATNDFSLFRDTLYTNACFYYLTNTLQPYNVTRGFIPRSQADLNIYCPDNLAGLYLWSNAVPATVELELGLLEQYSFERYESIGSPAARLAYLQREETSTRVHLFRRNTRIRNVDPAAYQ